MSASSTSRLRLRHQVCLALLLVLLSIALAKPKWTARLPQFFAARQLDSRQLDDARWWLSLAEKIAPQNPETEFLWSRYCRRSNDLDKARQHLKQASSLGVPSDRIQYDEILLSAQSGHIQETLPLLNGMLLTASHPPDVFEAYALGMFKARTAIRATADFLYAWSKEYPKDPEPHYLLAKLSLQLMDMEVASSELQQVLELDPEHAKGALAMGDLLLEKQDIRGALEMFETAARSERARLTALVKQAHCRRVMGQASAARSLLQIVFQKDSSSPAAKLELAHLELSENKLEAAISHLRETIQQEPNNHEAHYTMARALRASGRAEEARSHFKLANDSRAALVRCRYLVRTLVTEPSNADLRSEIGCKILAHGDSEEAIDWLNSALAINPRHQPTLRALVQHYESQSNSSGSAKALADEYRKRLSP